jgi:hypothetical protein
MKKILKSFLRSAVLSGIFALFFIGGCGGYFGSGVSSPESIANRGLSILSFGLGVIAGAIFLNQYDRNSM